MAATPIQKEAEHLTIGRLLKRESEVLERFEKLPPSQRVAILRNIDRSLYELRRQFDPTFPAPVSSARAVDKDRAWFEEQWSTACDES